MNEPLHPALLPLGLRDLLPPDAAAEAQVVERMMAVLESHGYQRVKPPLVEFEESLLSGPGAAMAQDTFRLMDPVSQRMIGLRADMTPQVARIAATRLAKAPRPLRLSYAGQVLRVKGGQLRPERQIGQVGAELIGVDGAAADVEAIALAAEALLALGIAGPLGRPYLATAGAGDLLGVRHERGATGREIRAALDHKDAATVGEGRRRRPRALLGRLLKAAGPARPALAALAPSRLPEAAAEEWARLAEVATLLEARMPELRITVDPVEIPRLRVRYRHQLQLLRPRRPRRARPRRTLCRGERQARAGDRLHPLYRHGARRRAGAGPGARVFLPAGTDADAGRALRAEGWVTVAGLGEIADVAAEARRLGCLHALIDGKITDLS